MLAGHGVVGPELAVCIAGNKLVGGCPRHGLGIVGVGCNVGECGGGGHIGLAGHAVEHGHKHSAGHGHGRAEGGIGCACKQAVFVYIFHCVIVPVGRFDVGEVIDPLGRLEGDGNGVCGSDVFEGVGGHRADGLTVHQNVADGVALVWGDGVDLVLAGGDVGLAVGRDSAVSAGGSRDSVGGNGTCSG